MYFKKLEIFGFKSFVDKTVFNFEPGITAIVGPNGCGKSNIFDSIRWVLGEQSVKELRGSSMEDVIFNGTESKPALGFAEVNLTLNNESRKLQIECDEVNISRKLFRSGESEYLLNKKTVRLKDIHELLMGTGVGAEAYSLIQQGKVDSIVSSRPEERRMLLDEAAGITKYKAKKKEALNKLKDTENNLLRVNDISMEVKRQIVSIERQANKARRYKEKYEKLKGLEVKMSVHHLASFTEQKNKVNMRIKELKSTEIKLSEEMREFETLLVHETNQMSEIEQKINDIRSESIRLDGQIDLGNRQAVFDRERIEDINQSNLKENAQKKQLIDRCGLQQKKIEELKNSLSDVECAMQANEQMLGEKRASLSVLEGMLKDSREKIRKDEGTILDLTTDKARVQNELTDIIKDVQGFLARKRRLEFENEKVLCEKAEVVQKLEDMNARIKELFLIIKGLELSRQNKQQILDELKAGLSRLDQAIDKLEKKKLFLKSQKDFIEKMHTQYEDMPDPVIEGKLITQAPPLEHHNGIIGKVKNIRLINSGNSESPDGEFVQAGTKQLYEIICETKFIELDPGQISVMIDEISKENENFIFQKDAINERIREQALDLKKIEEDIHNEEKSYSILEAQRKDVLEDEQKLEEELELIGSEFLEVNTDLESVRKKENELKYHLDTISQDIGWRQNDIKGCQDLISSKSKEKENLIVSIAQLETEAQSELDKLESQRENIGIFSSTLDSWLDEIKRIDEDILRQVRKKEGHEREIAEVAEKVKALKEKKEAFKGDLNDYNSRKLDVSQRIDSVSVNIESFENEINIIRQDLHERQLDEQKFSFDEKAIKDRLLQSYKIDLDEIKTEEPTRHQEKSEGQNTIEVVEEQDFESLQQEIEKLRKQCDSFGNVNLVAIEEYEELKERFEFLTKQQSDLFEAKSQLMSTIRKINRSTRQMFMDTFTQVSEEFRIYFRMLFGGGEAKLILLDPEDVLESGIDIIARPPGKKLQNISLLSGGERSLTAIALIFGVFKVNPTPFCVLDEIDAALDESNVVRFSYLLKDFSKVAQFLIITHNKKTIASADVMYGITMPETGVSRIVSVKFSEEGKKQIEDEVSVGV